MVEVMIACFKEYASVGKAVAKGLKCSYSDILVEDFPDGEMRIKMVENPRGKKVVVLTSMAAEPNKDFIKALLVGGICKDFKARKVVLLATYLSYMRQDKHFTNYESMSAKYVVGALAEVYDKILVVDPHLHRIPHMRMLSRKACEISTNDVVAEYLRKSIKGDFVVIGPDGESSQWSGAVAHSLGKESYVLTKTRNSSYDVEVRAEKGSVLDLKGRNIVIIDDIISTGRTITQAVKLIKKKGIGKVTVVGIHGMLRKDAAKRVRKYADLVTTNTVLNKYAKIDITPLLVKEIKKI